jgi:two-component system, chemotaxis family, sensor kinase CheA
VGDSAARIEIDDDEYAAILAAIVEGRPRREIARLVAQWRMERVQPRLERFAEQARALGQKLDKSVAARVQVGLPRLPRVAFAPFWGSLVHALRNAVDHGLETADERASAGKVGSGTLTLRSSVEGDTLAIEVEDDGRGIAWSKIADKARARGLPADSHEDLVQALFADGVSTAESVSDVSGRGVGMAALRDACHALGGQIAISSELGRGTCMSFRFPLTLLLADTTLVELPANSNTLLPRADAELASFGA